ncbi:M24 family metallopeptidase [Crateriforma spongiae]|uniref:M24 family metallopeptidase n=1 Tax=Crateriforma spongiae TaxID=2724528 RepID=UPI0014457BF9|nr:M24 family metallopeptidase [Crateriforma spongiae]
MDFIIAGFADKNATLYRRLGVPLGDPAAFLQLGDQAFGIVRDLEMDRVRQNRPGLQVSCPADHAGPDGLPADRESATAAAVANMVRDRGVGHLSADRTLPLIFAHHLTAAGVTVDYDPELGVNDRRSKTDQEIEYLSQAQATTESVMRMVCETIADATVDAEGQLLLDGTVLTSERVRSLAAVEFLKLQYTMPHGAIVATAPQVADCHHSGTGPLRTGTPIVVDLFPRCEATRYWGDCTRTVVHGDIDPVAKEMHAAVLEAKSACIAKLLPGVTADQAHHASEAVLLQKGYPSSRGTITDDPSIQHGTGHGIGLDVHEPILLDAGGGEMLAGEVFTVEPGLYGRRCGGIRVEDMVVVTPEGPRNLNELNEGLDWRSV